MLAESGVVGVDEKVGIDEDHLKASPSATARASSTLSMLAIFSAPRSTERVLNGSRFLGLAPISRRPRLKASLTSSFKLKSRLRRRRSSNTATSSSIFRAVLMHQNQFSEMY